MPLIVIFEFILIILFIQVHDKKRYRTGCERRRALFYGAVENSGSKPIDVSINLVVLINEPLQEVIKNLGFLKMNSVSAAGNDSQTAFGD